MHGKLTALLAGGGDIIVLDWTFWFQAVLFLLLFLFLRTFVFRPVMAVLDRREQATVGARREAEAVKKKAAGLADEFDAQLRKVRAAAAEERERLRQEGARLEQSLLDEAKKEVASTTADAESRLAEETKATRAELEAAVPSLAAAMASKVLGREVTR
ncbi:MAG TPA: ATP synthase F0 subunit B [Polyangiaceae bacterium LLY-WYZ-14_1]|nr:ATP synthase F0 subunit B [Polyangiaceae bacterium LLY-WYZ-14_1]